MSLEIISEEQDIDSKLQLLPNQIEEKMNEVVESRKQWQLKKALYENKYQQIVLSMKASDDSKTQSDLKADAITGSHQERLDMILEESNYRKKLNELERLKNDLDTLKERSYNFRAHLKRF